MKSKSGRSVRAQNSSKPCSDSWTSLDDASAMDWAAAAWDGRKSTPHQRVEDAAAWMLRLTPWPKPSSQAVVSAGGCRPLSSRASLVRSGLSSG